MTNDQKILEALANAGGQDVSVSRLREIISGNNVRPYIFELRKAGFSIRTYRPETRGTGWYRLEAQEEERARVLGYISRIRRQQWVGKRTLASVSKSADETNPGLILRAEIYRRRKENHEKELKRGWNPEPVLKLRQAELLDWIEGQLKLLFPDPASISKAAQALPLRKGALLNDSHERERGQNDVENDGTGSDSSNPGTGTENPRDAGSIGGTRT